MARNLKLFFDRDGSPRVRGPASEKILMTFLETDVQGSDHICHDLMDDITAIEDGSADAREFNGNAHAVTMTLDGVTIESVAASDARAADSSANLATSDATMDDGAMAQNLAAANGNGNAAEQDENTLYKTGLKHFREVLEDWEAFILDDQSPA